MKLYLNMVFICISLVTNDVDHLNMKFLTIYISSLEKYPFKPFAQFLIGLFDFLLLSVRILYIFCILDLYKIYGFQLFSSILWVNTSLS